MAAALAVWTFIASARGAVEYAITPLGTLGGHGS
jgi:hypothetical protein